MSIIGAIIITLVFISVVIMFSLIENHNDFIGRNHTSIIFSSGCGGDIHFNEMTNKELIKRLKMDYFTFKDCTQHCINAKHNSHLAEYRIENTKGKIETIGWITKDKVVFEGREYYFENN